jgi:hypothetical protein
MFRCLRPEESSDAAAWDRVYAAIGAGLLPMLLQQLLPVLPRVYQQAEQQSEGDGARTAVEVGVFLSGDVPGGPSL